MFYKIILIPLFAFSFFAKGICQSDTSFSEVGDTLYKKFNRGFYNSYTDFLNNIPSLTTEFTVEEKTSNRLNKKNIYRVKYKLKNGEDKIKKNIFGFADDSLFYVRITTSIFNDFFWKLECAGSKYPFTYIYISQKGGYFGTGFLFDRIAPFIDIYVLNEEGKFKYATVKYLKKLFSITPSLQQDFINNPNNFTNKVKKEFLIRFNLEMSKSNSLN